ncbi:MAG: tetratricopeptide repeat protein [Sterolibacterium sp.]
MKAGFPVTAVPETLKNFLPANFSRDVTIDGLALALLAIGLAALYGPHLGAPLVFDDIDFFGSNYASLFGGQFSPLMHRYWSYWSFAFQRIVFGDDLFLFRLVNVALHLMVGGAIYLFIRTLHSIALADNPVRLNSLDQRLILWLSVTLFLFHPVVVYGVAYLVERSIVMATLFSLLMWWAHLRGLASNKPGWFLLAILFYYLALYSKEHSVMAPAVACLLTLLATRVAAQRRLLILVFLAYFALATSALFASRYTIASQYEPLVGGIRHAYLASILTQSGLFFKYLCAWWVPLTSNMSIDIREPLAPLDAIQSWLSLAAFLAYGATAFHLVLRKGRVGLLGFAMLAPALLFMTEFSTVRIQESFVLYRSYLWLPPMLVALPLVVGPAGDGKRVLALGLAICAVAVLFVLTAGRLTIFDSAFRLWDEAIFLAERRGDTSLRDRQYANRGGTQLAARNFGLALQDFERALQWNPSNPVALLGKGRALAQSGRPEQARVCFDRALAIQPDWIEAYLARAELFNQLGNQQAALADFGQACARGASIACYAKEKIRFGKTAPVTISISPP